MTLRNGGQNDALHPNRNVHSSRWRPSNDATQPTGSQVLSNGDNYAQVSPQPWGHDVSLDRADRYETTHYEAGPFKTPFRAQVAAEAMSNRDSADLRNYRSGTTPH